SPRGWRRAPLAARPGVATSVVVLLRGAGPPRRPGGRGHALALAPHARLRGMGAAPGPRRGRRRRAPPVVAVGGDGRDARRSPRAAVGCAHRGRRPTGGRPG